MESLEKLHLEVIKEKYLDSFDEGGHTEMDCEKTASKSAQITKDIAIEFGRWVIANPELGNTSAMSRETAEYYFKEFLKTKQ